MEDLAMKLTLLGKKKYEELYTSLPPSTMAYIDITAQAGKVVIVKAIEISTQREGWIAIFRGNQDATWLRASKAFQYYSGDKIISINSLYDVVRHQEIVRVQFFNGDSSNNSEIYVNIEYFELDEQEFEDLRNLIQKELGVV